MDKVKISGKSGDDEKVGKRRGVLWKLEFDFGAELFLCAVRFMISLVIFCEAMKPYLYRFIHRDRCFTGAEVRFFSHGFSTHRLHWNAMLNFVISEERPLTRTSVWGDSTEYVLIRPRYYSARSRERSPIGIHTDMPCVCFTSRGTFDILRQELNRPFTLILLLLCIVIWREL